MLRQASAPRWTRWAWVAAGAVAIAAAVGVALSLTAGPGDDGTIGPTSLPTDALPEPSAAEEQPESTASETPLGYDPAERLGLHVSAGELALWRSRARSGPYVLAHDVQENSPADWSRIVDAAGKFVDDPEKYTWLGPTRAYPRPITSGDSWGNGRKAVPGERLEQGAAEPLRDAAFYAMVLGSEAVPDVRLSASERTEILTSVRDSLLAIIRSPYNDYSDRQRYDPRAYGNGFHPAYQLARWVGIVTFAYDYAQVADPDLWTAEEKAEFVAWLDAAADWYTPVIGARRAGMFDDDGTPTGAADEANGEVLWAGGPAAELAHSRIDNHVPRLAQVPTFAGLLAELERERSGVDVVAQDRIDELLRWGYRSIRDYLVVEVIPAAEGTGGGTRTAAGNFYRWGDPPPINGWKYAMEHLGSNLLIADHLARAGDPAVYLQSTTDGTSLSAGSLPDDGITDGGPKTLLGAMKQMLAYIDEDTQPVRYGCADCADEAYRIDSRDDINGIYRTNEWELLQANVFFRDPYVTRIYLRQEPGTPPLPDEPRSGQGWIENGSDGLYPGANFMFAQVEGEVWPYPEDEDGQVGR